MLKEIFLKNPNIIINTDIDGFLCGMLLQKYFGCKVVGFSNSKQSVWVDSSVKSIYDPVYVDLYVCNPDTVCIDQHIIGLDDKHNQELKSSGKKFNPNLERDNRSFLGDYWYKYPFATVHYLITLMENEGIMVELPDLFETFEYGENERQQRMCLGYIFLRADDALHTSLSSYRDNATEWWNWLLEQSGNADSVRRLVDFVNKQEPGKSETIKRETGSFFTDFLGCDGKDGAFNAVTNDCGELLPKVERYIQYLQNKIGWSLDVPKTYCVHNGIFKKENITESFAINERIRTENIFSYAFIYSRRSGYKNFSYTVNME